MLWKCFWRKVFHEKYGCSFLFYPVFVRCNSGGGGVSLFFMGAQGILREQVGLNNCMERRICVREPEFLLSVTGTE